MRATCLGAILLGSILLGGAACGRGGPVVAAPPTQEELGAELAVARAGCARCHAAPLELQDRLAPARGPDLAATVRWHADDGGEAFLRRHHGGAAAGDLAAWLASLDADAAPARSVHVSAAAFEHGERLFAELACRACHAGLDLEALARRADHGRVAAFLRDPTEHRPGVVHGRLLAAEADAVAAWLLREQVDAATATSEPGFAFECFELRIERAGLPELDGREPSAHGIVPIIDASHGSRERHFALRFEATLDVPATGSWTFVVGSDDSSWLWIDGEMVVRNEGLAPHHRREGRVQLTAGLHELRVLYTQAAGGRSLEVLWQGPGVEEQVLPAQRATAKRRLLVPPTQPSREGLDADTDADTDAEAVARGRAAAAERRCAACHEVSDRALVTAIVAPARAWSELKAGACPQVPGAEAIWSAAQRSLAAPHDAASALRLGMLRDGCLSCHARDGRGGLPPIARRGLPEVEDLGEEGRLPPDLTAVGRRLRPAWIEKVLSEGHSVRPYLRVRMPALAAERAREYATSFAAVDGQPGDDDEPPFSVQAAQRGRQLAGVGGRNCVTCHPFAGHKALGPQGMDLAFQHARMRPAWFREWLLRPATLRPGTRMPALWTKGDEVDRADVEAIFAWLSLGEGAPLPAGLVVPAGSFLILPADRPRLHGAFLKGLSARCIAVGSPERTHYAYDLAHARLAWIWRGAFLDAQGTWSGRAGKLLEPLGTDWVVLDDLGLSSVPESTEAAGPSDVRTMLGHRLDADGYPHWRVRIGTAEIEDYIRPRLVQGGSELVRTVRVVAGTLRVHIAESSGSARLAVSPPGTQQLQSDESLEVIYRW